MKTEIFTYGTTLRTVHGKCSTAQNMQDVAATLERVVEELRAEAPEMADVKLTFTCKAQKTSVGAGCVEWQLEILRATTGEEGA